MSFHFEGEGEGEGEPNPITSLASFGYFQDGHEERRAGKVDQQRAELVRAYITKVE